MLVTQPKLTCVKGLWMFNRISDGSPALLLDLALYLERVAATVSRQQLEAALLPSSSPLLSSGTAPHSSLTPNASTPSSALTPSNTTPTSNLTPNPATPYTPSPLITTASSTGPSPADHEEVYDTPPDRYYTTIPNNPRARNPMASSRSTSTATASSRKRSYSDYGLMEGPPKKFRQ